MRDYGKVEPKEWQGDMFKALRRKGPEPLLVALYLTTSPMSNMLGLFQQPILYMAHETGLGEEGARKGLQVCIEEGFCAYDEETEVVWVYEMAKVQIAPELKANDLRCKGTQKNYDALPKNPFLGPFFDHYAAAFHLTARREFGDPRQGSLLGATQGATQAPSKPRAGARARTGAGIGTSGSSSPASLPTGTPPTGQQEGLTLTGDQMSIPPCPLKQLVELFVAKVPELPKPRFELWKDSAAAGDMRQRWKWLLSKDAVREDSSRYASSAPEAIAWFGTFFDVVHESDFLTGRKGNWKNCDLGWLMKRENFMKVVQGNYANQGVPA